MNRSLVSRVVEDLDEFFPPGGTAAVLGLSYKPLSHVVDESQGVALSNYLCSRGTQVTVYDPLAGGRTGSVLDPRAKNAASARAAIRGADVVLITTPDREFATLNVSDFDTTKPMVTVVDFWRILRASLSDNPRVRYIPYGCSIADERNAARLQELWGDAVAAGVT